MDENLFVIVELALKLILMLIAVYVIPPIKRLIPVIIEWYNVKFTKEQRENAEYWVPIVIRAAEKKYPLPKSGERKKAWVIQWLNDNNISITEDQMTILINTVVEYFNKTDWEVDRVV